MELSQEMREKVDKSAENSFADSMSNLKSQKDKKTDSVEQRPSPKVSKSEERPSAQEKKTSKKEATEKASEVVSKRLNISDITDATKKAKKKGGRSRTFYFQDEMYDKLVEVATKQGIKPSQLLHAILDNVLDKM